VNFTVDKVTASNIGGQLAEWTILDITNQLTEISFLLALLSQLARFQDVYALKTYTGGQWI
jgi:hypothetical protein